jgi:hypothetical protein
LKDSNGNVAGLGHNGSTYFFSEYDMFSVINPNGTDTINFACKDIYAMYSGVPYPSIKVQDCQLIDRDDGKIILDWTKAPFLNQILLYGQFDMTGVQGDDNRNRLSLGALGNTGNASRSSSILWYAYNNPDPYPGDTLEAKWEMGNDYYLNATQTFYLYDSKNSTLRFLLDESNAKFYIHLIAGSNLTIGEGGGGIDYTLTFDGETNDGILTWMEDEDYFKFNDNVNIDTLTPSKVVFTDASKTLTSTGMGTSSQFIKGDGSLDSSIYLTIVTDADISTSADVLIAAPGITIDGGGVVPTTGSKGFVTIPYNGIIINWYMAADVSGSMVIDVKRSGTSIVGGGGNKPTLSAAQSGNAAVSGWTSTTITAGDILEFNLDSVSVITRINLVLKVKKT